MHSFRETLKCACWKQEIAGTCTVRGFCFSETLARALLPFACFGHVSVTELGQGQKAAVLVKVVKPQNKEMKKVNIMITHKGPVFFLTMCQNCFFIMHHTHTRPQTNIQVQRHTTILLRFYLHTCVQPQRKPILEKIKE